MSSSGDLAVAATTSDPYIVNTGSSNNIVLFWDSSGSSWLWSKQVGTGLTIKDMKIRDGSGSRLALLYSNTLVIVLYTADGTLLEAHTQSDMTCTYGCKILYPNSNLYVFGVVQISASEYLGLLKYSPESGTPTTSMSLF